MIEKSNPILNYPFKICFPRRTFVGQYRYNCPKQKQTFCVFSNIRQLHFLLKVNHVLHVLINTFAFYAVLNYRGL